MSANIKPFGELVESMLGASLPEEMAGAVPMARCRPIRWILLSVRSRS